MINFIKGFFQEGKPQSSRRLMGIISGFAFVSACTVAGFHFYEIPEYVIISLGSYSLGCLGVAALSAFSKN